MRTLKCQWEECNTKVLKMNGYVEDSNYCFRHHTVAVQRVEELKEIRYALGEKISPAELKEIKKELKLIRGNLKESN